MEIIGLEDDIRAIAVEVLTSASEALLADLVEAAPEVTGELKDSQYGPEIDEDNLTATIGFKAPQADYTDEGTPPHVITPRNATHLRFFWENGPDGPGVYTFQSVDHPGYAGSHWFTDGVEQWQQYVDTAAEEQR